MMSVIKSYAAARSRVPALAFIIALSTSACAQTGTLKGRILAYFTSSPIPNARITFKDFRSHHKFKITTDAQGNFELLAPVGLYRMTVAAKGFVKEADTVEIEREQTPPFSRSLYSKKGLKEYGKGKNPIIMHMWGARFR